MNNKNSVRRGSGNVFADLDLHDAQRLSFQAELARMVFLRIRELRLTQSQAAERLGLKQPDVSKLVNGRHTGFSADRLLRCLTALDQDVHIIVRKKPPRASRRGHV